MAKTIRVDPLTRVEGHLAVEVDVEDVKGSPQVVAARCSATAFRGFEQILAGRDPRDAIYYTQRICGVCPTSHAQASAACLEHASSVLPPTNGRIVRNLILAADHIQSHVLHFYQMAALDYVNMDGRLNVRPWTPRYPAPDMLAGDAASRLAGHYLQALEIRRKAHQMGAIFGAKLPCNATIVAGGVTEHVTAEKVRQFRTLLRDVRDFACNVLARDAAALGEAFPQYLDLGAGCRNLLAFGGFELDDGGTRKLMARGRWMDGAMRDLDPGQITESVRHSWYAPGDDVRPAQGRTVPDPNKAGAYSWDKAPRYAGVVYETGPLARMWLNGHYRRGISAMDRLVARAVETCKLAEAMEDWLDQLQPGAPTSVSAQLPKSGTGVGLTEAPRGALGHWLQIEGGRIERYQVIAPTSWNASPRDDRDQPGPIEQALVGTPVADASQPIEVLRIVHAFDPCMACSVHLLRSERRRPLRLKTPAFSPGA